MTRILLTELRSLIADEIAMMEAVTPQEQRSNIESVYQKVVRIVKDVVPVHRFETDVVDIPPDPDDYAIYDSQSPDDDGYISNPEGYGGRIDVNATWRDELLDALMRTFGFAEDGGEIDGVRVRISVKSGGRRKLKRAQGLTILIGDV